MNTARQTILLVDDTTILREIVADQLEALGYTVLHATSGQDALLVVAEKKDSIQLLLTDIIMEAGMHGPELATEVRARHPKMPILFMSGSGQNALGDPTVARLGAPILEKPFTTAQLDEAVRKLLAN